MTCPVCKRGWWQPWEEPDECPKCGYPDGDGDDEHEEEYDPSEAELIRAGLIVDYDGFR